MKNKRKLTSAQKKAKAKRREMYEWIFINGTQVRIKRPEMIEGMLVEDFIAANASDDWLHQNEMWHVLHEREMKRQGEFVIGSDSEDEDDSDIPF